MKGKMKKLTCTLLALVFCFSLSVLGSGSPKVSARERSGEALEETRYTKRAELKSEYQKIYDAVYDGIDRLEEDYAPGAVLFDFSSEDILFNEANGDTIYIPLGSILNDHPELEWLSPGALEPVVDAAAGKLTGIRLRSGMTNARITPYQDKSVFDAEMKAMNARISEILRNTEAFASSYEKLLYVHDWLVKNNVYNSYVAADESDFADIRAWSAVSAFLSGNDPESGPVCEGYSEAFKIICDRLGIPCVLLTGMQHQWNAVELDGKWYAVDCTWDDPTGSGSLAFVRHDYFLVGTETKTLGGTSTYGQDHITYSTVNIPRINSKGLALLSGVSGADSIYDGAPHGISGEPAATHGGSETGGDFSISYYKRSPGGAWESIGTSAPVDAGSYMARVSLAHSEYEGNQAFTYEITPAVLSGDAIVMDLSDARYSGAAVTKEVAVTYGGRELREGTDYTVAYRDNVAAGTAEISVTGTGNYTGGKTARFEIARAEIKAGHIGGIVDFTYDGTKKTQTPVVTVDGRTLTEGTDYTVAYEGDCRSMGTSRVVITGKGNYQGTCSVAFEITEAASPTPPAAGAQGGPAAGTGPQPGPETGDGQDGVLWLPALLLSMLAMAGCAAVRKGCRL